MLRLEEVHSYYGASHVVQGVSLSVARGETVALVGRNGAGKTTLLKTIMGIVPARRGITLVPEDRRIFPRLTVAETLEVAALGRGGGDGTALDRVLEYFPRL